MFLLMCYSILDPKITYTEQEAMAGASSENIIGGMTPLLTPYDVKRLESYASNLVDYHLVTHLSYSSYFPFCDNTLYWSLAGILITRKLKIYARVFISVLC